MDPLDRVISLARELLTLESGDGRSDLWLWEHGQRVMRLAQMLTRAPEAAVEPGDATAVAAAALFHDAGWAVQVREGRLDRWQVCIRPTNDLQRELGAALLEEQARHLVPADTLRRATQAIRWCNDRSTTLAEARLVADADSLDEVGAMYLLRQLRQYQAEGRPIAQLVNSWARQKEYGFWDARISEGFHFETSRRLARARLEAVDHFMVALARDAAGSDVERLLGGDASPPPGAGS